ncbi:hypothetical protein SO802_024848 [Lithocarpus litseifolius]|uniref:Uncharacterized protein n=1 Tax=Lithocarpus litseifolius TaxID=425828 RepID=A0AAW2CFK5_9ROSI
MLAFLFSSKCSYGYFCSSFTNKYCLMLLCSVRKMFIDFFTCCSETMFNCKLFEKMPWEPLVVQGFLECRSKYLVYSKSAEDQHKIASIVSAEFCGNSKQVDWKIFLYVEYLLSCGKKQLDQLKIPDTIGLSLLNVFVSEYINPKP